MTLRVVDFQELTKHYKTYQDGLSNIDKEKNQFLEKLKPLKNEMNKMIQSNQTNQNYSKEDIDRFEKLQEEAVQMENDFKPEPKKMKDELNDKVYDELKNIISNWSNDNNIDIVFGKMEVVFNKKSYECTDSIINIIKEKNMYV